ncbi:hypothetical protein PCS_01975 [Desulfocurvibacter africanus PCS]|uniref:Uncharacterized protein n=1 Tax=Desulfocurvibacter africanus PCS TaxID=1262666 RepID=M5PSP5_DESAF|nr:hypothetical protein PCS_01975 [Desulfocurvibacter africanus PCS]
MSRRNPIMKDPGAKLICLECVRCFKLESCPLAHSLESYPNCPKDRGPYRSGGIPNNYRIGNKK